MIASTKARDKSLTSKPTLRPAVDRAFPEAEFIEVLEKEDFVLELEHRLLAAPGDQGLNQRERFEHLPPLLGPALQPLEDVRPVW